MLGWNKNLVVRDLIGRLKASSFSLTLSLRCRYNLPLKTGFTSARGFYIIISMKKVPDLPSVFVKVTENERTCFYQVLMFACPYLFPVIKLVKLYFTYFHRKCQCSAVNYNAPQWTKMLQSELKCSAGAEAEKRSHMYYGGPDKTERPDKRFSERYISYDQRGEWTWYYLCGLLREQMIQVS